MLIGQLAFVTLAAIIYFSPTNSLLDLGYGVIIFFLLQGLGRAAYEGANKVSKCVFERHPNHDPMFTLPFHILCALLIHVGNIRAAISRHGYVCFRDTNIF